MNTESIHLLVKEQIGIDPRRCAGNVSLVVKLEDILAIAEGSYELAVIRLKRFIELDPDDNEPPL